MCKARSIRCYAAPDNRVLSSASPNARYRRLELLPILIPIITRSIFASVLNEALTPGH